MERKTLTDEERKLWAENLQVGDVALEKCSNPGGRGNKVTIVARRGGPGCESGVWLTANVTMAHFDGTYTVRWEMDSHWFWPPLGNDR